MPNFASKHSAEKKKCSYLILILVSAASPRQKQGSRTQPPSCCLSQSHPGDTHQHPVRLCCCHCTPLCSPWPKKLFQICLDFFTSALHCPCLYLQGCVWCFLEDWKSYRSSLNLRGQAKQTGREQNSSGCLTHTGFEIIMQTPLSSPKHAYCLYSLCLLIPKACSETDMSWSKQKYHKILL